MPKVNEISGVTHFRWVAPDFVSDKPFRVIEEPEQIAYWEKRFERWKGELDRAPKTSKKRRLGLVTYLQSIRTSHRTMLIEEPVGS